MKGQVYEYNGNYLTQAEISRLENINRSTLADWYKKTQDIYTAVEGAKKSLAQRNIPYKGQVLSLKKISTEEQLKFESLQKAYQETNDIYKAVEIVKANKLKRNGSIEYNGQMLTITAIAALENLEHHSLSRHYKNTNNIYEAVKLARQGKERQNGTIPYKNELMTLTKIANLENIKKETLKEFYELYNDIEKAVYVTKEAKIKRQKALLKGKEASYEELSKYFEISPLQLDLLIKKGYSLEDIEKKTKKGVTKENQLTIDENSLYKYCLDHSYNYWTINHIIKTYNKNPQEAIQIYLENGQKIPTSWIYEKYSILFKHLSLKYNLDSNRIIKIMKDNNCGIEQAIEELIFISNNENNDLKKIEIDRLKELYPVLTTLSPKELEEAKKTFYISERELKILQEKGNKIEYIKRQLVLFDISTVIKEWSIEELINIIDLYELTEEERKTLVVDLYSPYQNQIINPTKEHIEKENLINNYINDDSITPEDIWLDSMLTDEEKETIIEKRELLDILLEKEINNNKHI